MLVGWGVLDIYVVVVSSLARFVEVVITCGLIFMNMGDMSPAEYPQRSSGDQIVAVVQVSRR